MSVVWFDHTQLKCRNGVFQRLLLQVGIISEETISVKRDMPCIVCQFLCI